MMSKRILQVAIAMLPILLSVPMLGHKAEAAQMYEAQELVLQPWDGGAGTRFLPESMAYRFAYGDEQSVAFDLPWPFPFYGQTYTAIVADTNGNVWLGSGTPRHGFSLTATGPVIAAWNADLDSYCQGGVFVEQKTDRVVVSWHTTTFLEAASGLANTFAVALFPNGDVRFDYQPFATATLDDAGSGLSRGDGQSVTSLTGTYGLVPMLGGRSFLMHDVAPPDLTLSPDLSTLTTLEASPTLVGTCEARSSVSVTVNGGAPFVANDTSSGNWQVVLSGLRENDNNSIEITARDAAGNATVLSRTLVYYVDADSDSLPDVWESAYGVTGGAEDDGDSDGLDNLGEYIAGTNPNNVDSDGDGILDGLDPLPTQAASLTVAPVSMTANSQDDVQLSLDQLTPGATATVTLVADLDNDGTADLSEPVLRSLLLTDGILPDNPNIPGDEDTLGGRIATHLGYAYKLDVAHAPGNYLWVGSAGGVSRSASFTVTPVSQAQTIAGTVTDGTLPVPGALVQLTDKWQRPVAWAVADANGQYLFNVAQPGDYRLVPQANGYAVATAAIPLLTLSAGAHLENQTLTLTAGTYRVQGQVGDLATGFGIAGVTVAAQNAEFLAGATSDVVGSYEQRLPAGDYQLHLASDERGPSLAGYVGAGLSTAIAVNADQVGIDVDLPAAPVLVSGTVRDAVGPLTGIPVVATSAASSAAAAFAVTGVDGSYALALEDGSNWTLGIDPRGGQSLGYIGTNISGFDTASSPLAGNDLTAHSVDAWVQGTVRESGGAAASGVDVILRNADSTLSVKVPTAADGSYRLGTFAGSWLIKPAADAAIYLPVSEQSRNLSSGQVQTVDFTLYKYKTLAVTITGSGSGVVTSSPSGLSCGGSCASDFIKGSTVVLTATPDANSEFSGWSGGNCTGVGVCTTTLDESTTIFAVFSMKPPVAEFGGTPTSGVQSVTVNFVDLSSMNPTSWYWEFGDGTTSTLQNPTHTYNVAGSYTVKLSATNAGGTNTMTKTNYVVVQPYVIIQGSSTVYSTIQEAYDVAQNNSVILVRNLVVQEDLDFNLDKTIIIEGGYDEGFNNVVGDTEINGSMSIEDGSVIIGNLIFKQ